MGKIRYNELFEALRNSPEKHSICKSTTFEVTQFLTKKILEHYKIDEKSLEDEELQCLEKQTKVFASSIKTRWRNANHTLQNFLAKNANWLNNEFEWTEPKRSTAPAPDPDPSNGTSSRGRPCKNFNELSERGRRKRTEQLRAAATSEELVAATISCLYIEGKKAAADLVTQATQFSPSRPVKLRQMIKKEEERQEPIPYTPDEALDLYIECRLSKRSYVLMRKKAKDKNFDIYPSYNKLLEARKRRYPEGLPNMKSDTDEENETSSGIRRGIEALVYSE